MKLTYLIVLSILITNAVGCKKFLQQEPYNTLSVTDIFKDVEGARTVLINCYDDLKTNDYYMRNMSVYADLVGGNIKYSRATNQTLFQTYSLNNTATATEWTTFFTNAYNIIYACNSVLENVENISDANIFQKNRFKAEAKTLRALVHFDLVRIHALMPNYTSNASHSGITIRKINTNASTPPATPSTVGEVYTFILQEIDSSIALYNNSVAIYPSGNDRTYCSANAARALKCRAALYNNDWATVIATANAIPAATYPLITNANYINAWRGKVVLTEGILELDYGNRVSSALGDYYNNASTNVQYAATNDLLNIYDAADVRSRTSMYNTYVVNGSPFLFTKKYNGVRDSANNIRLLRMSEVILSRAEAYAETNNLTAALTDLNLIKKRAWPAAPTYTSTIQQDVITEILKERRKELCFEGHLLFDISRKKQNLIRGAECQASINCTVMYPSNIFAIPIPLN